MALVRRLTVDFRGTRRRTTLRRTTKESTIQTIIPSIEKIRVWLLFGEVKRGEGSTVCVLRERERQNRWGVLGSVCVCVCVWEGGSDVGRSVGGVKKMDGRD